MCLPACRMQVWAWAFRGAHRLVSTLVDTFLVVTPLLTTHRLLSTSDAICFVATHQLVRTSVAIYLVATHQLVRTSVATYLVATHQRVRTSVATYLVATHQLVSTPTPPLGSQHSCQPTVQLHMLPLVWTFPLVKG